MNIEVSKTEFYHILTLIMCSDPWPVDDPLTNQGSIKAWANKKAKELGYTDWIDAYHKLSKWYEKLL